MKTFSEWVSDVEQPMNEGAVHKIARVLGWGSLGLGLIQIVLGLATGNANYAFGGVMPAAIGTMAANVKESADPGEISQHPQVQNYLQKMGVPPEQGMGVVAKILKVAKWLRLI